MPAYTIGYDIKMGRLVRFFLAAGCVLVASVLIIAASSLFGNSGSKIPVVVTSPFLYTFNSPGTLQEAGSMRESSSPYWWLNSGGELIIRDNVGMTMHGTAPISNRWRILYAISNPIDTDGGIHPQNLFRLVTRSTWRDAAVQAYFLIDADNFSESYSRNASNGLFLMNRYQMGGQTLYYAGIRVDGTAVIKKKYRGVYYTMAQKKIFAGTYTGWQDNVNLLPHRTWLALKAQTYNEPDGSVRVELFMKQGSGEWSQLLSATDSGQYGDTSPITEEGFTGIRSDFMDVQFENFRIENLP